MDNSFGHPVEISTNFPIFRHIDRKRYLKVIATSVFKNNIVMMGKNNVRYLFRSTYQEIGEIVLVGQ